MIEQRNKMAVKENGQNNFRTIVSEVSSFVGNPVLSTGVQLFGYISFIKVNVREVEMKVFIKLMFFRTKNLEHK